MVRVMGGVGVLFFFFRVRVRVRARVVFSLEYQRSLRLGVIFLTVLS